MARPKSTSKPSDDNAQPPVALPITTTPWQPAAVTALAVVALAVALLPAVVSVSPELYWDIDPRSSEYTLEVTMLGPAGMTWLAAASMLTAALALVVHHLAGKRVHLPSAVLALFGMGFIAIHVTRDFDNMTQSTYWLHAICTGLSIVHLAQHKQVRTLVIATLVGMIAPYYLDSLMYVYSEHPQTLERFAQTQDEFLRAQGWTENSPQALAYMRRMSFADATGPFGLSNIFGSMVGSLLFVAALRAISLMRSREYLRALWPGALTLAALHLVYLTHSKGAVIAGMMIAALLLTTYLIVIRLPRIHMAVPLLAIVAVAGAFGAVFVRASMGPPETHEGERSLLFRYHYWQAAADIIVEHPVKGVGPGSFQEAYSLHKNPINPEEVTSAHNVFVDYISMIGLGGIAWSALLFYWLWLAGKGVVLAFTSADVNGPNNERGPPESPASEKGSNPANVQIQTRHVVTGLLLVVGVYVPQFIIELPKLLPESALLWAVGAVAVLATILVNLEFPPTRKQQALIQLGLFGGAAMLLVHNQIEMSFFQAGSASLGMIIVAAAAAGALQNRENTADEKPHDTQPASPCGSTINAPAAFGAATLLVIGFVAYVLQVVMPITQQQNLMRQAAEEVRSTDPLRAFHTLEDAIDAWPRHPRNYRSLVRMKLEYAMFLAQQGNMPGANNEINSSLALLDTADQNHLEIATIIRLRAQVLEQAAALNDNSPDDAVAAYERVLELQPKSIQDHHRFADLLWRTGDRSRAKQYYERTLELSSQAYLDPLKQLSAADKERIEARLTQPSRD